MSNGLELDPFEVLGIRPGASAREVRGAYRRKSLTYHPDRGGEEWAFRVVAWAYRQLGAGATPPEVIRLFRVSEVESELAERGGSEPSATVSSSRFPSESEPVRDWTEDVERIRAGVRDRDVEPERLVQVEIIWMRHEVEDVFELLKKKPGADRHLSGTLHLRWPDPAHALEARSLSDGPKLLTELRGLYEWLRVRPDVLSARIQEERGELEGWLNYASGSAAWQAFTLLRPALRAAGLGVRQWTRDLTIPRNSDPEY